MKKIITILIVILMLSLPHKAFAAELENTTSAKLLATTTNYAQDNRTKMLKAYLEQYNSPLADHAQTFVEDADKYNLDWKLVAAISGVESTFGEAIPADSYNGWGWGVYGDNVIRFTSWDNAIDTISQGLRERYLGTNSGSDPYMIGPTYAASPTWAVRVASFMDLIQQFDTLHAKDQLSISL